MEAPIRSFLQPLPESEVLTKQQWKTLMAIADTIVACIPVSEKPSGSSVSKEISQIQKFVTDIRAKDATAEDVTGYFEENASSTPAFQNLINRSISLYVPKDNLRQLSPVLYILSTWLGSLVLTGSLTPLHKQPIEARQKILEAWQTSYIQPLRILHRSLSVLSTNVWLATSEYLPKIIGFTSFPAEGIRKPGFDFKFITFPSNESDGVEAILETDVVIIGSGCGGGISAKNLAEAGIKVLVVEKGYHYSTAHFPVEPTLHAEYLLENGGVIISDDTAIATIPASCFGGGGTVNWSASLHTQKFVRDEWAQDLPFFASQEFEESLNRAAERMGASTKYINHNFANKALLEIGEKLGYDVYAAPQNTGNAVHDCGYCMNGCSSACKQGPAVSFLPDAAKAGAQFMQGFKAERILFEGPEDQLKATGVIGVWTSPDRSIHRKVKISAKRVIVSAGSMNSPLLLRRSGLTNSQIGKNLHLHPVTAVRARYAEEIRPWDGPILTSVVDLEHTKIEVLSMLPRGAALITPWKSGMQWKKDLASYHHWAAFIVLNRDLDSGRVYEDNDGFVRVAYTPSKRDTANTLEGVIAAARIHYLKGAEEIASPNPFVENFQRAKPPTISSSPLKADIDNFDPSTTTIEDENDAAFEAWLTKLQRQGIAAPFPCMRLSAHQMGSCRMSSSPRHGVVDPRGQVWGTKNLYVADASVFPSASGVNPMLTTLGIADWISRGIVRDWDEGEDA